MKSFNDAALSNDHNNNHNIVLLHSLTQLAWQCVNDDSFVMRKVVSGHYGLVNVQLLWSSPRKLLQPFKGSMLLSTFDQHFKCIRHFGFKCV